MHDALPSQNWKWTPVVSIGGALVLAAFLFLLIPFTQIFHQPETPDVVIRQVGITVPPPASPPPPPAEVRPSEPTLPFAPAAATPQPIDIQPLNIVLAPGMGEAVSIGAPVPALQLKADSVASIQDFFTFADLNEAPRMINSPRFRYPRELSGRGINEGQVVVEIDILPDGKPRLRRIVSSTHRELEPAAREIISQARFTRPEVDGQPQTVRGRFPLLLQN